MGKKRGEGGILGKWGGKKRKTKEGKERVEEKREKRGVKGIKREGEAKGLISIWRGREAIGGKQKRGKGRRVDKEGKGHIERNSENREEKDKR